MKAKRAFLAPGAGTGSIVLAAAILAVGAMPARVGAQSMAPPVPDASGQASPVAAGAEPDLQELAQSSLEQLMDIKVATVSGAPPKRGGTSGSAV